MSRHSRQISHPADTYHWQLCITYFLLQIDSLNYLSHCWISRLKKPSSPAFFTWVDWTLMLFNIQNVGVRFILPQIIILLFCLWWQIHVVSCADCYCFFKVFYSAFLVLKSEITFFPFCPLKHRWGELFSEIFLKQRVTVKKKVSKMHLAKNFKCMLLFGRKLME